MDALMFAPELEMHPKSVLDSFNTVFKVLNAGTIPPANIVQRIQCRILIFDTTYTPDLHSMCFVLQGSPGVIFPAAFPGIEMNINGSQSSAFIAFPDGYVLYNAIGNRFFFVFFSLSPITMNWVDKVICQLAVVVPVGQNWITVDRSQGWYFAMSPDGLVDYRTYFFPDTLKFQRLQ
jgi:hypothetical protein